MIYRVVLIGNEGHLKYTLDPLAEMKNVKLSAYCDPSPQGGKKVKDFDAYTEDTKEYTDYRKMLEELAPDIAAIYTIHSQTAQTIVDAAQAGCHIYSEKPPATTLEDLERIRKAVTQAEVNFTLMLNMRFLGTYRTIHEIVKSGEIGEVTQCTAQKSYKVGSRPEWSRQRGTYAGTIPYIACHALDLIRWCSGLEFVKGTAFHNNVGNPYLKEMENTASILILADNGATITTRLDYCRPGIASSWGDDRLRIAGTKGVVEALHDKVWLLTNEKKFHEVDPLPSRSQFKNLIETLHGREELILSAEDCFRITEVVLKLRNAADTQSMVDL